MHLLRVPAAPCPTPSCASFPSPNYFPGSAESACTPGNVAAPPATASTHITGRRFSESLRGGAHTAAGRQGRSKQPPPRAAGGSSPARSAQGQSATACLICHREKFNKLLSAFPWELASTVAPLLASSLHPPGTTPHTKETVDEASRVPTPWCRGAGRSGSIPQLCKAPLALLPAQPAAPLPALSDE